MIYKDALVLQQAFFNKRDEILNADQPNGDSLVLGPDPLNDTSAEFIRQRETLPIGFVTNAVQRILEYLFDCMIEYQDLEGRVLSETFLDTYQIFDRETSPASFPTLHLIKTRLAAKHYKRLDAFQDELFHVFAFIRRNSYFDLNTFDPIRTHRASQLYKDSYDLQKYFIQKRDELCRNGDLLQSGAASYKSNTLDHQISLEVIGSYAAPGSLDESEVLLVDQRLKSIEMPSNVANSKYSPGAFYYAPRQIVINNLIASDELLLDSEHSTPLIVCVLACGDSKAVLQIYLRPIDIQFIDPVSAKTKR